MSSIIALSVIWGKETFEVSILPSNGVKGLKTELKEKTGVPIDRMKIMPKSKGLWKGLLKDNFDLTSIDYTTLKPPIQILLMGSSSELSGPKVKTVFIEDLPDEDAAKVVAEPSGLVNMGNTCYLNSVLQALRVVPELRSALSNYGRFPGSTNRSAHSIGNSDANRLFLSNLRNLFSDLDRTTKPVQPNGFLVATFMSFPQFAQLQNGHRMQQDAEEFLSGLLNVACQEMEGIDFIKATFSLCNKTIDEKDLDGVSNLIDAVFGIKMEETLSCDEFPSTSFTSSDAMAIDDRSIEPIVTRYDLHRKLVCNIQGGSDSSAQINVTHILEGISLSLNGKVEKRSEVLGRDALWTRRQRLARLPPVLVVQFGRFFWKETPDSQDHAGVKCKIMKPVAFQATLDVYDFCSEKIRKILKIARDKAIAEEEDRIARKLRGDVIETATSSSSVQDSSMSDNDEVDEELKSALAMSLQKELDDISELGSAGPGLPVNFQGKYELFAVVTHKGRDADGGHYMSWVKADSQISSTTITDSGEANDDWFVFDDDEVSPCKTQDILELKGGGDWHTAYLCLYRAKK